MSDLTIYENSLGQECVLYSDENGQMISMLKSVYDEQQAALKPAEAPKGK